MLSNRVSVKIPYRFKTQALIGPWRPTRHEAEADAVAARQAEPDAASRQIRWRVDGTIETTRARGEPTRSPPPSPPGPERQPSP